MSKEIKLDDNLNSEIVKIISLTDNKYAVYFDFLTIPVEVDQSFLNSIVQTENSSQTSSYTA